MWTSRHKLNLNYGVTKFSLNLVINKNLTSTLLALNMIGCDP